MQICWRADLDSGIGRVVAWCRVVKIIAGSHAHGIVTSHAWRELGGAGDAGARSQGSRWAGWRAGGLSASWSGHCASCVQSRLRTIVLANSGVDQFHTGGADSAWRHGHSCRHICLLRVGRHHAGRAGAHRTGNRVHDSRSRAWACHGHRVLQRAGLACGNSDWLRTLRARCRASCAPTLAGTGIGRACWYRLAYFGRASGTAAVGNADGVGQHITGLGQVASGHWTAVHCGQHIGGCQACWCITYRGLGVCVVRRVALVALRSRMDGGADRTFGCDKGRRAAQVRAHCQVGIGSAGAGNAGAGIVHGHGATGVHRIGGAVVGTGAGDGDALTHDHRRSGDGADLRLHISHCIGRLDRASTGSTGGSHVARHRVRDLAVAGRWGQDLHGEPHRLLTGNTVRALCGDRHGLRADAGCRVASLRSLAPALAQVWRVAADELGALRHGLGQDRGASGAAGVGHHHRIGQRIADLGCVIGRHSRAVDLRQALDDAQRRWRVDLDGGRCAVVARCGVEQGVAGGNAHGVITHHTRCELGGAGDAGAGSERCSRTGRCTARCGAGRSAHRTCGVQRCLRAIVLADAGVGQLHTRRTGGAWADRDARLHVCPLCIGADLASSAGAYRAGGGINNRCRAAWAGDGDGVLHGAGLVCSDWHGLRALRARIRAACAPALAAARIGGTGRYGLAHVGGACRATAVDDGHRVGQHIAGLGQVAGWHRAAIDRCQHIGGCQACRCVDREAMACAEGGGAVHTGGTGIHARGA